MAIDRSSQNWGPDTVEVSDETKPIEICRYCGWQKTEDSLPSLCIGHGSPTGQHEWELSNWANTEVTP